MNPCKIKEENLRGSCVLSHDRFTHNSLIIIHKRKNQFRKIVYDFINLIYTKNSNLKT